MHAAELKKVQDEVIGSMHTIHFVPFPVAISELHFYRFIPTRVISET